MFNTSFFDSPLTLLLGALTGFVFGFLLQKGSVTKFNTIVGQFLLKDFTVVKVMFTAVVVGGIGVYAMLQAGIVEGLHIKNAQIFGNALGGLIFGVGMAILGYCPGTGVAAIGDGAKDAIAGVFGMLAGAALYAEVHPWFKANVLAQWDLGKATFVTTTGLSPWWFIAALVVGALAAFRAISNYERKLGLV